MSAYVSLEEARSAGASGSDAEVLAAIEAASARVERYTRDVFEPTLLTQTLDVLPDGVVRSVKRIIAVDSVALYGVASPLDPTGWRLESDGTILVLAFIGGGDITINGAEPYNGGWANLMTREPRVIVTGTFGWATPPYDVKQATALIAAAIRGADVLTDSATTSGTAADAEGNVLPVVPPFNEDERRDELAAAARVRSRTTGVLEADALLASYVREPVRIRA